MLSNTQKTIHSIEYITTQIFLDLTLKYKIIQDQYEHIIIHENMEKYSKITNYVNFNFYFLNN